VAGDDAVAAAAAEMLAAVTSAADLAQEAIAAIRQLGGQDETTKNPAIRNAPGHHF
jgi:hypothetical protein